MAISEWCHHYRVAGVHHLCLKGRDVVRMCGGTHAIRFRMPCQDDKAEGHDKVTCADRLMPSDIIRMRALAVRAGRELPI